MPAPAEMISASSPSVAPRVTCLAYGGARHLAWRRAVNAVMLGATGACALALLVPLALILGYLLYQGFTSLSWAFFTTLPKPAGEAGGGVANAIVGSAIVIGMAAAAAVPLGVMVAVLVHEFARGSRFAAAVRFTCDMINSTPSIILGLFAFAIVVTTMGRFSAIAGSFALFTMMIPVVARGTEEILRTVPDSLREASLALGASRWQTIRRVVLPAVRGGIATAVALSLARISGETAPLLFTALGTDQWAFRPDQPMSTLPVRIYQLASSPYPDYHKQAWAAALVLVALITAVNGFARWATRAR